MKKSAPRKQMEAGRYRGGGGPKVSGKIGKKLKVLARGMNGTTD